jgi:hypothetical protein
MLKLPPSVLAASTPRRQQNVLGEHQRGGHIGLHRRTRTLGRMHGVERRIEPFVDGVIGRRQRHRHQQAGHETFGQRRDIDRSGLRHDHRKGDAGDDQDMLDPVVGPRDGD